MRRHIGGWAAVAIASAVWLAASGISVEARTTHATAPSAVALDGSALQTLINQDRAANGLGPLTWSPCLASIALQNAQRIAAQGSLSHTNGPTLDLGCGNQSTRAGENIAYISSGIDDPQVNTMYMNSAGHRANILGAYNYVGTAWVTTANGYGYNAEEFLYAPSLAPWGGSSQVSWESLGGPINDAPAVAAASTSAIDAFVRGKDSQLWHRSLRGGSWQAWESLGGVLSADPAAVSSGNGQIDVFIRGSDLQLWHKQFDGVSWRAWEPLGGVLGSAPSAASPAAGRLDVFVRGTDGQLWQRTYNAGTWGAWSNQAGAGGVLGSKPAAVSSGSGRLDVFIRGRDMQLWQLTFNGTSWGGWQALGGTLGSGPAAASSGSGRLDVFVRGTDSQLWHRWWDGSVWQPWNRDAANGGVFNLEPAAVAPASGRVDVFVHGLDNGLWHETVST